MAKKVGHPFSGFVVAIAAPNASYTERIYATAVQPTAGVFDEMISPGNGLAVGPL
jgi:hypothetical protein